METLRAVLANDGVVYTRVGGGGESDLYYYTIAGGEVEVGADLGPTILGQTKAYRASTTSNQILFEVTGATDIDVYLWDPATGSSTAVATTASLDDRIVGLTSADEVVIDTELTPVNHNLAIYTHGVPSPTRFVAVTADNEMFEGSLTNGDLIFRTEAGGGDVLNLYDTSLSSVTALTPGGATLDKILSNDKVAYTTAGGVFVVNTTGGPVPVAVAVAGSVFAGETSGGDFTVQVTAAAQLDLELWDESAGAPAVSISAILGDDSFGVGLSNGDILFLREDSGKTTTDLFLWNPGTMMETQLTDTTVNHAVPTAFAADNS